MNSTLGMDLKLRLFLRLTLTYKHTEVESAKQLRLCCIVRWSCRRSCVKKNICDAHCFSYLIKRKRLWKVIVWWHNHNSQRAPSIISETCFDNLKMVISMWKTKVRRRGMMTQLKQRYCQQWLIWITRWSKNDRNGPRDMTEWFCYTTMPHLTHLKLAEDILKSLGWDILPSPRNPLTWRHLSPLRINRTRTCREALQQFRSWKMAQRTVCRKTKTIFLARYS